MRKWRTWRAVMNRTTRRQFQSFARFASAWVSKKVDQRSPVGRWLHR
jgi:hypothetical protein